MPSPSNRGGSFACALEVISWVEVFLDGSAKEIDVDPRKYERLIRLRLRNDLSMIPHEVKSFGSIWDEHSKRAEIIDAKYDNIGELSDKKFEEKLGELERDNKKLAEWRDNELNRRGVFECTVWTIGKNYPVAYHVSCVLSGMGEYKVGSDRYETAFLGYTSAQKIDARLDEAIRNAVASISNSLLEHR